MKETFIATLDKLIELKRTYEEIDDFIKEKCPNKDFVTSCTLSVFLDDYEDLIISALASPFQKEEEVKDYINYLVYDVLDPNRVKNFPNVWVKKKEYTVKDSESLWNFIAEYYKLKRKING